MGEVQLGEFHHRQRAAALLGVVAGSCLGLVVAQHADQVRLVQRRVLAQRCLHRRPFAGQPAFHQGQTGVVAEGLQRHRRAAECAHDGLGHRYRRKRVLPGDQAAIDDHVGHHQWRLLPQGAEFAQPVFQQERELGSPALAKSGFFFVGEAGQATAFHQRLAVGKLQRHQCRRPVAHRGQHAAGLVVRRQQALQGGVARQVEHGALAADHQHRSMFAHRHVLRAAGALQRRGGQGVGLHALDVVVGGVVAVGFGRAAGRAGHVDLQPVRAQRQPGLGEFVHLEAGAGLASVAAFAADHQQHLGRGLRRRQRARASQGDKRQTNRHTNCIHEQTPCLPWSFEL